MSRNKEFFTTVNGVTGFVPPRRNQADRLYDAESFWKLKTEGPGKTISEQGAKDLLGEIVHHPALNEFPNMAYLRQHWTPDTHVTFEYRPMGTAETESTGDINFTAGHKILVGTVTHEAAHLANLLGHQFQDHEGVWGQGFEHEWPYANTHLHIAHNILGGKDVSVPLKNLYRMFGVQWMPKHRLQ